MVCSETFDPSAVYDSVCVDIVTGEPRGCASALCARCLCDDVTTKMSDQVVERLSHTSDFKQALEARRGLVADYYKHDDDALKIPCPVCTDKGVRLMSRCDKLKESYFCCHDGCEFFMTVRTVEVTEGIVKTIAPASRRAELTAELTCHLPKHADIHNAMGKHRRRCPHNPLSRKALCHDTFAHRALREAVRTQDILIAKNEKISNMLNTADAKIRSLKRRIEEVETDFRPQFPSI